MLNPDKKVGRHDRHERFQTRNSGGKDFWTIMLDLHDLVNLVNLWLVEAQFALTLAIWLNNNRR